MTYRICFVGGTDGLGLTLATMVKKRFPSINITITGRNNIKGTAAATSMGVRYLQHNQQAVADADAIVFCVPIRAMESVIKECAPYIAPHSVVVDIASIKKRPSQIMYDHITDPTVTIIPTHPMFGPSIQSLTGQVIVLTPTEDKKQSHNYQYFLRLLQKAGAQCIEATPQEHDEMMSIVQGLTHFCLFALGQTLYRMDVNYGKAQDFNSPIYQLLSSMIGRYYNHDPNLYADIQCVNPRNKKVHEIFIQTCQHIHKQVVNKDTKGFIADVAEVKQYLGNWTQSGQKYSDKIIALLTQQKELLHISRGKSITIKHISSDSQKSIVVDHVDGDQFYDTDKIMYHLSERIISLHPI